jgi:thymidylate synthase
MRIYSGETFSEIYGKLLSDLSDQYTNSVSPRGQKVSEFRDCYLTIQNPKSALYKNKRRSSMLKYISAELIWYFSGDNRLDFISKYAKFWETIKNEDDTVNSAYGNLIFKQKNKFGLNQWQWAVGSLLKDKDSRQAVLHFNKDIHQFETNKDFVCTMYGIFSIRNNKLDFTLHMRSNDVILGLPTDIAFFCALQIQMLKHLKDTYPELELGVYNHMSNSMHLYERNNDLVNEMLDYSLFEDYLPEMGCNFIDINGEPTEEFKKLEYNVKNNISNDYRCDFCNFISNKLVD